MKRLPTLAALLLAACASVEHAPAMVTIDPPASASVAGARAAEPGVVRSADELLRALDRALEARGGTIALAPGDYVLSRVARHPTAHLVWEASTPDTAPALVVRGARKLRLTSQDPARPARLLTEDKTARVLTFEGAEDVELSHLIAGHTEPASADICLAVVLGFHHAKGVALRHVELFGSGTHGLFLQEVEGFGMEDSVIRSCTQGLVVVDRSTNVRFARTRFRDTTGIPSLFSVSYSRGVVVERCEMTGNRGQVMFEVEGGEPVRVVDTRFESNLGVPLATRPGGVVLDRSDYGAQ